MENVWDTESLASSIETFKENVPEDTMAFGFGMPELYYQMGWDNQISITDWADMNHFSIKEVERVIEEVDSFVMEKGTQNYWVPPSEFTVVKTIITENFECMYYERIKH